MLSSRKSPGNNSAANEQKSPRSRTAPFTEFARTASVNLLAVTGAKVQDFLHVEETASNLGGKL